MSMDGLQERIRKRKCALILDLTVLPGALPKDYGNAPFVEGYCAYIRALLKGLKGIVPGVRFSVGFFSLLGGEGLAQLPSLTREAGELGYYVLLETPQLNSQALAEFTAQTLLGPESLYHCDGVQIPFYGGSDVLMPFLPYCEKEKKDVFVCVRTPNRSAPELQDLLTGSRLVHMAAANRVSRYAQGLQGKYGYARVGLLASAGAADSLRSLREKYPGLFLLADGLDYPSANLKNVSLAFDKLGRGAAYCAGEMVTLAWRQKPDMDPVEAALAEVQRQQKGLGRYLTFL